MSPTIKIWWDEQIQAYRVSTPYNAAFVNALKATIPHSDRIWDQAQKIWTVTEKFMPPVKDLAELTFHSKAHLIDKAQAQAASSPPSVRQSPLDDVLSKFMRLLPYEAARESYRRAALILHPDRGGDMAQMSEINALWTRIEKEVYKK